MVDHLAGLRDGYVLRFAVVQSSQNVGSNASIVNWSLNLLKGTGNGKYMSGAANWSVTIDGQTASGSIGGYDFRGYSTLILGEGSFTIPHNSDGTKSIGVSGAWADNGTYGELGNGTAGGTQALTTIPRATTATFTNPMFAGSAYTVNLPRASTSFTHNVDLWFGNVSNSRIATGAGTSFSWTPPLDLLNQMPNGVTGTGFIRVSTYNGGTLIGTKDQSLSISAPASIVPTFSGITHSDLSTAANTVGGYVQWITRLRLAITNAAGTYGSTIQSASIVVNGQTVNGLSGDMPSAITSNGSMSIQASVTDSRGRSNQMSVSINVMGYSNPAFSSASVQRSNASGTAQTEGTYLRVAFNASTASLIPSGNTQRNALVYRVYVRVRGTTAWTLKANSSVSTNTLNTSVVVGTYSIQASYEVRIEISDYFSTSATEMVIATASIFMHWDAALGVGIGKFREQGMLDVAGQIFQNSGAAVLDQSSLMMMSIGGRDLNEDWYTGTYMGATLGNAPNGSTQWFYVEIIRHNNLYQHQRLTTFAGNNDQIWVRSKQNGTWGAWQRVFDPGASPHAQSAGKVALTTLAANASQTLSVTFPAGRFSQPPIVSLQSYSTRYTLQVTDGSVTTSGFTMIASNFSGAGASSASAFTWHAVQMSQSGGAG